MLAVAPQKTSAIPERTQHMPLLRSLADCAARVAINMALLTELFATRSLPGVRKMRVRGSVPCRFLCDIEPATEKSSQKCATLGYISS